MRSNWLSGLILAAAIPLSASAADMNPAAAHSNKKPAMVAQGNTKGAKQAKKTEKKAKTPKAADTKAAPKS